MGTSDHDHPDVAQLRAFLKDRLQTGEAAALESHLESCPPCCRTLESLDADDPFASRLRQVVRTGPPSHAEQSTRAKAEPTEGPSPNRSGWPTVPGYEILGEQGRGGMGVVYRARQISLHRLVALKMLLAGAHASPAELVRFRTEALAAGRLRHPNLVQVHEVGTHNGLPYIVMELVEGGTLAAVLDGRPQPPRAAARFIETLARAIHAAHQQGVLHRDLKPGNILLQRNRSADYADYTDEKAFPFSSSVESVKSVDDCLPKITDFGLAKLHDQDSGLTGTGTVLGTPCYMAPEQATRRAGEVSVATDVYGLGALLYELLTGRPPFQGLNALETVEQVINRDPVPPESLQLGLPRDLCTICLKCLEKPPARRYASAEELADDLQRFLAEQPIRARPASVVYRWGKFARRNKALVGAVAGVTAALVVGLAVSIVFALREARQRQVADENATQAINARQKAQREAYQARLAAMPAALAEHDVAEAERHLQAAPAELRGWEWHHLASRLDDSAAVLAAQSSTAEWLLALFEHRGPAALAQREPQALHAALAPRRPRRPEEKDLLFAPTDEGLVILARGKDAVWHRVAADGRVIQAYPNTAGEDFIQLAASRDGRLLAAAGSRNGERRFTAWDAASGAIRIRCPVGWTTKPAFRPDGKEVACVGEHYEDAAIWDVASGEVRAVLKGGNIAAIVSVAYSPDGRYLATGGEQNAVLWDAASGTRLQTFRGHRGLSALACSPDGTRVAVGSEDRTIRFWRIADGDLVTLHGHRGAILAVAFSPDGRWLLSAGADGSVRLWDAWGLDGCRVLRGHTSYVYPVAFSPDGRWFASGAWDATIRLWDAASAAPLGVLRGHTNYVTSLAISPDGRRLVSRGRDETLRFWDAATGEALAVVPFSGEGINAALPTTLAFDPAGTQLAVPSLTGIHLLDAAAGQEIELLPATEGSRLAAYRPDGARLATATGIDPVVQVWDVATRRVVLRLEGHRGAICSACFSRDGSRLLTSSADGTAKLWDAASGACLETLVGHSREVFAAVFLPDEQRIATGGRDKAVRIWDTATGDELLRLNGHTDYVFSLACSPDGHTLVSGSGDYTVRLWDDFPVAQRIQARREQEALRAEGTR